MDGHMFESKEYIALCVVGLAVTTLHKTLDARLHRVTKMIHPNFIS